LDIPLELDLPTALDLSCDSQIPSPDVNENLSSMSLSQVKFAAMANKREAWSRDIEGNVDDDLSVFNGLEIRLADIMSKRDSPLMPRFSRSRRQRMVLADRLAMLDKPVRSRLTVNLTSFP
jgi:hypothetical protein